MQAYSLDLRQRVLAACQSAERTLPQVATQFSVSVSFITKLLRRQRTSGSAAALPPRGGPAPVFDPAALAQLTACLQQQPDATLAELGAALLAAGGPPVSRATLARAVVKLGWRRKKSLSTPPSAPPPAL